MSVKISFLHYMKWSRVMLPVVFEEFKVVYNFFCYFFLFTIIFNCKRFSKSFNQKSGGLQRPQSPNPALPPSPWFLRAFKLFYLYCSSKRIVKETNKKNLKGIKYPLPSKSRNHNSWKALYFLCTLLTRICGGYSTSRFIFVFTLVTIIPTNLVINWHSSFLSFRRNRKQESNFQQFDSLITKKYSGFCLQGVALDFTCSSCWYYSSM